MKEWYKEDLAFIHDVGFSDYALKSAPGILEILAQSQIREGLVVDLGCGSGLSAQEFAKAHYQVLGVDISESMIVAYEAANRHRQMLWLQEASQNQGLYFKQVNPWSLYEPLLKILERGMAEECFRPLDPFLTLTHILSICIFYFTLQENWKHLTPESDRLSPEMVEKHTSAAIEFILTAVKKTS
jgi:SAM-dependent methyltransferase